MNKSESILEYKKTYTRYLLRLIIRGLWKDYTLKLFQFLMRMKFIYPDMCSGGRGGEIYVDRR